MCRCVCVCAYEHSFSLADYFNHYRGVSYRSINSNLCSLFMNEFDIVVSDHFERFIGQVSDVKQSVCLDKSIERKRKSIIIRSIVQLQSSRN